MGGAVVGLNFELKISWVLSGIYAENEKKQPSSTKVQYVFVYQACNLARWLDNPVH